MTGEDSRPIMGISVALGLGGSVRNFLPENRGQAIQAEFPAAHLDVGMEGHDEMAAVLLAGNAHVSDNTTNPATRREHARALGPNLVELAKKLFVVLDLAELVCSRLVIFQGPIWRRGDNKVDAPRFDPRKIPGVAEPELMRGPVEGCRPREVSENTVCAKHFLDRSGRIVGKWKAAQDRACGLTGFESLFDAQRRRFANGVSLFRPMRSIQKRWFGSGSHQFREHEIGGPIKKIRRPRAACEPPPDPLPSRPKRRSAHQARASTSKKGQPVRHRASRWREAIPNAEGDLKRNVPVYSAAEREARKARNQSVWSGIGSAGIRCRDAGAGEQGAQSHRCFHRLAVVATDSSAAGR